MGYYAKQLVKYTIYPDLPTFKPMNSPSKKIDIINEVLEACIVAYPVSSFIISLYKQYQQRGWLSKKQLEGLYDKAGKIEDIAPGKLSTLEAMIKKMPTRYRSDVPANKPLIEKDDTSGQLIDAILSKYPQHKAVLFLKSKYETDGLLSPVEIAELTRLSRLLK
jgi:hypothetical protein